jgi:MFS family permease
VLAAGFVQWERRAAAPLFDLRLLSGRGIRTGHGAAFLLGVTQFVFYVLIPGLAELPAPARHSPAAAHLPDYGFGCSVAMAGLILVPGTLLGLPASAAVGRVGARFGPGAPLGAGLACSAIGGALLAAFHAGPWQAAVCYAAIGLGFGAAMGALPGLVHAVTSAAETATANGINTVAGTIGGAVGSQCATAILVSNRIAGTTLPDRGGFASAFWIAAAAAALGACVALTGRGPTLAAAEG